MRWIHENILWLLLAAPLLPLAVWVSHRAARKRLHRMGDAVLLDGLVRAAPRRRGVLRLMLLTAGFVFAVLALARPQWGIAYEEVNVEGVDVVLAVDVSTSMLAEDLKPNRITRTQVALQELLRTLEGNRIGLLAFAGDAHVLCPLTLDYSAVELFLDLLNPLAFSPQGTRIGDAVRKSFDAFGDRPDTSKVLILLTDGEDHESEPVEAAREAAERGIIIYAVGIAAPQGAPIPLKEEGLLESYKKDDEGEIVLSRLDEETLKEMAAATGGLYLPGSGRINMEPLRKALEGLARSRLDSEIRQQHKERYQWPLGIALACFLAETALVGGRRERRNGDEGRR
jgi:Ca-activated chloride channel family protein